MPKRRSLEWYRVSNDLPLVGWRGHLRGCIHFIDSVSIGFACFAAVCCGLLAFLTCVLVVLGAFNWVHNGFEELKWHLCGTAFMLSGAFCLERNAHVRVDTLYARFSPRAQAIVDMCGIALFVWPFALMLTWNSWSFAVDAFVHGEGSNDAGGLPYRWVIKMVIPLGFFLLFLQSLAVFLRGVLRLSVANERSAAESEVSDA